MASSFALKPYREVVVTAVPWGTEAGTERLPRASGDAQQYRSSLLAQRTSEGGHPTAGPDATLFGQDVPSTVTVLDLHLDGPELVPTVIVEWVAQAGIRTWILRVSEQLDSATQGATIAAGLAGVSLSSPDPSQGSTVPVVTPSPASSPTAQPTPSLEPTAPTSPAPPTPAAAPTPSAGATPTPAQPASTSTASRIGSAKPATTMAATAPYPPWWNGTCDSGNDADSYPLGASYDGVAACGPRPIAGGTDYLVHFYSGAWGEYEWECVELVMRYLYLVDGVAPYAANGSQVVWNYSGTALAQVGNGTAGEAPLPGDVLSYGSTSTFGHASIVSSSNVSASGNGQIAVVEENNTAGGTTTMQVSNWVVQGNPYPVSGWLHDPSPHGALRARYWVATGGTGRLEAFMRGSDGQFWHDVQNQAGNDGSWSGWYPLGGYWPGEPVVLLDATGRLQLFARGGDGQLWHAYQLTVGNSFEWSGFSPLGGAWPRDPVVTKQGNGAIDAFLVGGDGQLWNAHQTDAANPLAWSGFQPLGGSWQGQPAVAQESDGRLDVFLRGGDRRLWHADQQQANDPASWTGFYALGGGIVGDPAVARNSDGRLEVLMTAGDAELLDIHELRAGGSYDWSGFTSLGGSWARDPTVGVNSDGRLAAFLVGGDGQLWHAYEQQVGNSASWSGFYPLGGFWPGDPASGTDRLGHQSTFLVGGDGQLWVAQEANPGVDATWSGFSPLGGDWPMP
ncbi:MAG: CHAP domain-containing protein [Candidatus Dormiibacterota bacterium]